MMSREDAEKKIAKNVLVRSVGIASEIEIDISHYNSNIPSTLLLCSDGLSNMVSDDKILNLVNHDPSNVQKNVENLIQMANDAGGEDNISVIFVRLDNS